MEIKRIAQSNISLTEGEITQALKESLKDKNLKKVLLIPPDITRFHSNAGFITNTYYHLLKASCKVDILPALGTHKAMTSDEMTEMYGDIPQENFIVHQWREDIVNIGEVPASFISEITDGLWNEKVIIEINKLILDKSYDLILSIGQVVPHEVIGMANHSKNLFVGCGGQSTINPSHMIGAVYGMERMMGQDHSPVRKLLDYALTHFTQDLPLCFVLTVTTALNNKINTHGLFIGDTRKSLEDAIKLSQEKNINFVQTGLKKVIVYLDPKEFKSTWLGNKAIYRTRMAIADGGELIILAPGITQFGEDRKIDSLIRKYGYIGRLKVLEAFHKNIDLQENMSAAAHLIHGSSDDRFKIIYAVKKITKDEIESVNFNALDYDEVIIKYPLDQLKEGFNLINNEEVYFISNPALGLWINKEKFKP